MSKTLFIIRGIPGSGKSTLGHLIAPGECYAADDYFDKFCGGEFRPHRLEAAHEWCKQVVEDALEEGAPKVAVANTSTRLWEMKDYMNMAALYGYTVFSIIVENHHNCESVHQVPKETVEKMRERFEVKL